MQEKESSKDEQQSISIDDYWKRYLERDESSVAEAKELFFLSSKIDIYAEEAYDALIGLLQTVTSTEGVKKCVDMILEVGKESPRTEIEIAQINAVLEIICAALKKNEDKWLNPRRVDDKSAYTVAAEKSAQQESPIEPQKQTSFLLRPNIFSMRKLSKLRAEFKWKSERRIEKAAEQEEKTEAQMQRALEEVLQCGMSAFIQIIINVAESLNLSRLFNGEWSNTVLPNLQIDFLGLAYTYLKGVISLSIMQGREISNAEKIKSVSQAHYKGFLSLFSGPFVKEMENELVVCLELSMSVCLLLNGGAIQDCYALFSQEGKNILPPNMILYVQKSVLRVLGLLQYKQKNKTILEIVFSFFSSQCLENYTVQERKGVIQQAAEVLDKYVEQAVIFRLIKRVIYAYESTAQYSESVAQMISVFLSCIRTKEKERIEEISKLFTKIIARSPNKIEHIEPYCNFLAMHEINIPLHHLIRRYDPQFIATFYSTYFRHPFTLEKGTRAVGDFINFVNLSDDLAYIYIMNMVPFIPTSPFIVHKLFLIYKRVYANIDAFSRGVEVELLLLRMKTPALVGIAGFIFSDPKPLISKKILKRLAAEIKINPKLNEDYIVFLALLRSVEKAKLENYNHKGIISYLKDEVTLKYLGKDLLQVIKMVHEEIVLESKEFVRMYACELLRVAAEATAYPLSLSIIAEVLQILFRKEPSIVFVEEVHVCFRECFDMFRVREFSLYSKKDTFQTYSSLYSLMLKKLKDEATEAYNYIALNIVDLGLFHALPVMRDERGIRELLDRSNLIIRAIREFPTTVHQGIEIWEWLYALCVSKGNSRNITAVSDVQKAPLTQEEYNHLLYIINTEWVSDLITLRGDTPGIIENTRNYLRWMLAEEYSLETLMVLLKVSNREEKKELLEKAVLKGYSIRENPDVYYELYKAAKGMFYEFPLSQTCNFLYAMEGSRKRIKSKEIKEQELYELNIDELIFLCREYNMRRSATVLMKKQIVRCCGFFLNIDSLSVIDAFSVIANSEDEQEIGKALVRLENEEKEGKEGLLFYVPQIVQLLQKSFRKNSEEIKMSLVQIAKNKTAQGLIWEIRAQGVPPLKVYEDVIMKKMSTQEKEMYGKVALFLQNFAKVSERLKKYVSLDRDRKKAMINKEIGNVSFPDGCYLLTTGETVIRVVEGSGKALQSAEKVPYMVTFKVKSAKDGEPADRAVIFKFGDDCRQDVLALQIIRLFQQIFEEKGLSVFLYPYKVLATGEGTGIIEVIPCAVSRDQIGRERVNNLVDYFSLKYGYREGHKYTQALKNFVESFAGYSLVTYILNIKDRHNGNIMITDEGHMIHIDFGFMFDISPGNINIESPIKITDEIFSLLGGSTGEAFMLYRELMVKGFYLLRKRAKDIVLMVDIGKYSSLPCYTASTVQNLITRFRLDLKDDEVPAFVHGLITSSTKKLRTWIYDQYQHLTNNIAF